jgi:hypothetical protein
MTRGVIKCDEKGVVSSREELEMDREDFSEIKEILF